MIVQRVTVLIEDEDQWRTYNLYELNGYPRLL